MSNDSVPTSADDYDYVLVGAGSASSLIAARLSQQLPDRRILVLEAGEHIRNDPRILTPGLSATLQENPAYDWQYCSVPEPGLNGRKVKHPRGKLVGGTSAINSHSVVFPNHEWHDRLAETLLSDSGKADWSADGTRNCYRRWQAVVSAEKLSVDPESTERVRTSYPPTLDFLQSQWIKVFEDLGHTKSATGFTDSSAGAVTVTNAIDSSKGERSHAATAFLEPAMKRGNLTLKTGVMVGKIEFDEASTAGRKLNARGVRYIHQRKEYLIRGREILLCAGVFETPALLERSGIGSKDVLADANVPVLYELPGVGENLQDHLNCSLSFETREDVLTRDALQRDPEERKAALLEYERSHSGPLSEGPVHSFAFTPLQLLESPSETEELIRGVHHWVEEESSPGLRTQYGVIQKAIENSSEATATTLMIRSQRHKDTESLPKETPPYDDGNYVTVVAMLAHPFSRGSCHISPGPSQQPEIKFNYLSHPLDTEILARHMRLIERLFQQPTFKAIAKPDGKRLPRTFPYPMTSLDDAKKMLPINCATNYHPCGTCSMMREELGGVVDEQLRVYGTRNVRVCDASLLPIIPRGNILTAVYAFAEKAAELIVREARSDLPSA